MKEKTLKQKLERLNEISRLIDDPDIELEKALELYTESVRLAADCQNRLNEARQKITELSLENGAENA